MFRLFLFLWAVCCLSAATKSDELLDKALDALKTDLKPIVGLDNLNLAWQWRHYLILHQAANLTCRWGSVYPMEQIGRVGAAAETQTAEGRIFTTQLSNTKLEYRYDNCGLMIEGKITDTEPLWGDISNNQFDFQVRMGQASDKSKCLVTVTKLGFSEQPKISTNPNNKIVEKVKSNGYLSELNGAISNEVERMVNQEMSRFVGKRIAINVPCP